jgi:UDP-glucose 4-epimerase
VTSRNVLVTGGAGYVGAHACKALAKAGYTPFVYDNLSTWHESFVRWGPLIKADIRDHATLREVMLSYDVVGTLSLLRAMLETNTPTVVFSSSCAIYGEPSRFR